MADTQDKWAQRITAAGAILTPALTLIVLYYQSRLSETTKSAAEHAKVAAEEVQTKSKELKNTLDLNRQERKKEFQELSAKQDADLQSWKAYHTKEPEDMNKAHEAIARVEEKSAALRPVTKADNP